MGTPHSGNSDEDTFQRSNEVLYSCARIAAHKRSKTLPDDDIRELAVLAVKFEQIATVPILSVFEDVGTDPRASNKWLFGKKKKVSRPPSTLI